MIATQEIEITLLDFCRDFYRHLLVLLNFVRRQFAQKKYSTLKKIIFNLENTDNRLSKLYSYHNDDLI